MVKNQVKERFINGTYGTAVYHSIFTDASRGGSLTAAGRLRSFVIVIGPSPMAGSNTAYSGLHWNAVKYGRLRNVSRSP